MNPSTPSRSAPTSWEAKSSQLIKLNRMLTRSIFNYATPNIFQVIFAFAIILFGGVARADTHKLPETIKSSDTSRNVAMTKKKIGIVLFNEFETLDVFGPVEMWGDLPDYQVFMVSQNGGLVKSAQGVETNATYSFDNAPQFDILMVPGGMGARREVNNSALLEFLRRQDKKTEWTTSVCTGSAILAKAGVLKGRRATSNKLAYEFATSQDRSVLWQGSARWVVDGKYVTSSGVSAGTDMALGLVEIIYNRQVAEKIAHDTEYIWNDNAAMDLFSVGKSD